ncbi:MAG: hypothetical protein R3A51_22940 [Nannocystaceae bacterium]
MDADAWTKDARKPGVLLSLLRQDRRLDPAPLDRDDQVASSRTGSAISEHVEQHRVERQRSRLLALGLADDPLTIVVLLVVARDSNAAASEVDVSPAQLDDLAAPEPEAGADEIRESPWFVGDREQRLELLDREPLGLPLADLRQRHPVSVAPAHLVREGEQRVRSLAHLANAGVAQTGALASPASAQLRSSLAAAGLRLHPARLAELGWEPDDLLVCQVADHRVSAPHHDDPAEVPLLVPPISLLRGEPSLAGLGDRDRLGLRGLVRLVLERSQERLRPPLGVGLVLVGASSAEAVSVGQEEADLPLRLSFRASVNGVLGDPLLARCPSLLLHA